MSSIIKRGLSGSDPKPSATFVLEAPAPPAEPEPPAPVDEAEELEAPPEPDPQEVAREIVLRAESRAGEITDAAQVRARQVEEEARKRGYALGRDEAEIELENEKERLREGFHALARESEAFYRALEGEVLELSVEIARKVLKQELVMNTEAVLEVVRHTLRRVKERDVILRVHPSEVDLVREHRGYFGDILSGAGELEVVGDRRVDQGGCIAETPGGNLDARLESQLEVIGERLAREYEEGGHAGDAG